MPPKGRSLVNEAATAHCKTPPSCCQYLAIAAAAAAGGRCRSSSSRSQYGECAHQRLQEGLGSCRFVGTARVGARMSGERHGQSPTAELYCICHGYTLGAGSVHEERNQIRQCFAATSFRHNHKIIHGSVDVVGAILLVLLIVVRIIVFLIVTSTFLKQCLPHTFLNPRGRGPLRQKVA